MRCLEFAGMEGRGGDEQRVAWAVLQLKFRAVEVQTHGDQLELGLLLVKPFTSAAGAGRRLAPSY